MAAVFHFYDSGEEDDDDDDGHAPTGLPATLGTNTMISYKPSQSRTTHVSKQTLLKYVCIVLYE